MQLKLAPNALGSVTQEDFDCVVNAAEFSDFDAIETVGDLLRKDYIDCDPPIKQDWLNRERRAQQIRQGLDQFEQGINNNFPKIDLTADINFSQVLQGIDIIAEKDPKGWYILGEFYDQNQNDPSKAAEYWRRSGFVGYIPSLNKLSELHARGQVSGTATTVIKHNEHLEWQKWLKKAQKTATTVMRVRSAVNFEVFVKNGHGKKAK